MTLILVLVPSPAYAWEWVRVRVRVERLFASKHLYAQALTLTLSRRTGRGDQSLPDHPHRYLERD